jgi:hypothetical protein
VDKALTSIGQITDNDRKALRALNVIRIDATPGRFVAELLIGEGGVVGESAFAALRKLLPDLSPGSPPILRLDQTAPAIVLTHKGGSSNSTGFDERVILAMNEAVQPEYYGEGDVYVSLLRDESAAAGILLTFSPVSGQISPVTGIAGLLSSPGVGDAVRQLARAASAALKLKNNADVLTQPEVLPFPKTERRPAA